MPRFGPVVAAALLLGAADPTAFDHRAHDARGAGECKTCHPAQAMADRERPGAKGHALCLESCHEGQPGEGHAKDFFGPEAERDARVCTVCHESAQYGAASPLVRYPEAASFSREFYATIDHRAHLKLRGMRSERACLKCHRINPKTRRLDDPDHGDCSGCHDGERSFAMDSCGRCHEYRRTADGNAVRTGPRRTSAYGSVRGKFEHRTHRVDRTQRSQPAVSCGVCHPSARNARRVRDITPTNGMKTMFDACGRCHKTGKTMPDGKPVFSVFANCTKCHLAKNIDASANPH